MEFKGTKGKWIYSGNEVIIDADGYAIIPSGNVNIQEKEYNFKLASKSPEMLEALQQVIKLKDLIEYDESIVNESNIGEASAISQMLNRIQTIIKEATEI